MTTDEIVRELSKECERNVMMNKIDDDAIRFYEVNIWASLANRNDIQTSDTNKVGSDLEIRGFGGHEDHMLKCCKCYTSVPHFLSICHRWEIHFWKYLGIPTFECSRTHFWTSDFEILGFGGHEYVEILQVLPQMNPLAYNLWRYAKRVTLDPYCATYHLQDLSSRAQLSGGYWSNVSIRILQPGELRGRKTSSSFCCPIRSGRASIPPWTLWSSRFLSCGAASVEFTSSRYSELWNWTGHFQKETKNFFNTAVADSASEVSMHQRRYTNTRYYYYYYYNHAGASFQLFLWGQFFFIFQCHRTVEKLEKTALYM